jgi:hypothetical protein
MEITKSINTGKMYWGEVALPSGAEIIGTVTRGTGQTGALIQLPNGNYVQGNAGTIRTLAAHEVHAAMDAYTFGRPPLFDEPARRTTITMTDDMIRWLKAQPGGMSDTIRRLVQSAMDADK